MNVGDRIRVVVDIGDEGGVARVGEMGVIVKIHPHENVYSESWFGYEIRIDGMDELDSLYVYAREIALAPESLFRKR